MLLNICLSSWCSGRQAGPELTCGLCCLVTLPGTLDHACAFTGVSCLGQDHRLFFILVLLTLACEIALALNSFLYQWVPWNVPSGVMRMLKDSFPSWGKERLGWKEQVCKQELFLVTCSMSLLHGEQGSLCFPPQLRTGSGLCGHEPGTAVMPLVCVNCGRTQLQSGVAALGAPLQRAGRAFSSPHGQLVAGRSCRRDLQAVQGVTANRTLGTWAGSGPSGWSRLTCG